VARLPSVLLGVAGCLAAYGLGVQLRDVKTGVVTALLLAGNPLFRLHARRAMSDVPAEAFLLLSLACGLWCWRRLLTGRMHPSTWLAAVAAGALGGLAALSKLNGALALIVLVAWGILAVALPRAGRRNKGAIASVVALAGAVSLLTFSALNPFLTARPGPIDPATSRVMASVGLMQSIGRLGFCERYAMLVEHRRRVSSGQQGQFAHDALTTARAKLEALIVQGYGRFGPFGPPHSDSTVRFEMAQDWGAIVWLPWVIAGAWWAWAHGRRQWSEGVPPTGWAVLVQAIVSLLVVTAYLPLAWDRYFVSIQAGSALLAAGVAIAAGERLARRLAPDSERA
jgi:4-amino-4-deoxy-L-arabinose transferase-like glycosyltransferase